MFKIDVLKKLNLPIDIINNIYKFQVPKYNYLYEFDDIITNFNYINNTNMRFSKFFFSNFLESDITDSDTEYYGRHPDYNEYDEDLDEYFIVDFF